MMVVKDNYWWYFVLNNNVFTRFPSSLVIPSFNKTHHHIIKVHHYHRTKCCRNISLYNADVNSLTRLQPKKLFKTTRCLRWQHLETNISTLWRREILFCLNISWAAEKCQHLNLTRNSFIKLAHLAPPRTHQENHINLALWQFLVITKAHQEVFTIFILIAAWLTDNERCNDARSGCERQWKTAW